MNSRSTRPRQREGTNPAPPVHIRWMIRRDLSDVLRTEMASFEYAWSEEDFLRCLRQRHCIGMVAEQGESIVGFMIYELQKSCLHLLNFAVHPSARRTGIGTQMIQRLIQKMEAHRRRAITLLVRERNLTAQLFFRKMGFQAVRLLRHYYPDTGEDAYQMEYRALSTANDTPELSLSNRISSYESD
ncbi:MAG: ribosomal protein S18-alanine N-acetyltransferase [Gemmataceae bacterium]|jgi:ribosomal-protein-alanine N-acetyltransferase|uniref:Ribosomal protein S18-alanine N-acetyltransferase n=1 Tax=Thermogemmata fonticola TaxID=2755323 RepID=A0A7V8VG04_9BACT|nr:ribosomal protein S18-alanine N-acetyltransferase [Thermogemmata fonticola]MBA2227237.1 ribosomal protein S18-alanine N-acetyltransferase [Thermogemmata fonticola]MCX8138741.1 ribosomal protein S18-alanine N-acetyltransferase [Gemmataceae bacterium]